MVIIGRVRKAKKVKIDMKIKIEISTSL